MFFTSCVILKGTFQKIIRRLYLQKVLFILKIHAKKKLMTLQGSNLSLMMYGAELSEEAVKICRRIRLSEPLQKRLNAMVSVRL